VEFTTDVLFSRVKPYKLSQDSIREPFDSKGVRTFNYRSLEAFLFNKQYLEQELVVLFHNDEEEADEVHEALGDIAAELRRHHVYRIVLGKINMNHNDVSEIFPVHSYPSVFLLFKSSNDDSLSFQEIEAGDRRDLFH
jgi:hypothetical protein